MCSTPVVSGVDRVGSRCAQGVLSICPRRTLLGGNRLVCDLEDSRGHSRGHSWNGSIFLVDNILVVGDISRGSSSHRTL